MAAEKGKRATAKYESEPTALERIAEELANVTESEFKAINVDLLVVSTTALGVLPKLESLMERIRKQEAVRLEYVEKFGLYADALYEAHAKYLAASRPAEDLAELVEQGTVFRDRLYADVQALIQRDLINPEEIREVRTSIGHKALAMDLTLLTEAVKGRFAELQGKTGIEWEELQEAQQLTKKLRRAIGEKEQAPAVIAEASAVRSRVYALFARSYDEVRRVVTFLRWHEGDAEVIAPSFYQGRGGAKKKDDLETPAKPPAEPVVPPVGLAPPALAEKLGPDSDPFGPA